MFQLYGLGRILKTLLAVLSYAALLLAGLPAHAQGGVDKLFGDWTTVTLTTDAGLKYAHCETKDQKNSWNQLQLSKDMEACVPTRLVLTTVYTSPLPKDFNQVIDGELRVDDGPVLSVKGSFMGKQGNRFSYIGFDSLKIPDLLIRTMEIGQIMRVHFTINDTEYYYRFSLKGFRQAFARTTQLCAAGSDHAQKTAPSAPKTIPPPEEQFRVLRRHQIR